MSTDLSKDSSNPRLDICRRVGRRLPLACWSKNYRRGPGSVGWCKRGRSILVSLYVVVKQRLVRAHDAGGRRGGYGRERVGARLHHPVRYHELGDHSTLGFWRCN